MNWEGEWGFDVVSGDFEELEELLVGLRGVGDFNIQGEEKVGGRELLVGGGGEGVVELVLG